MYNPYLECTTSPLRPLLPMDHSLVPRDFPTNKPAPELQRRPEAVKSGWFPDSQFLQLKHSLSAILTMTIKRWRPSLELRAVHSLVCFANKSGTRSSLSL